MEITPADPPVDKFVLLKAYAAEGAKHRAARKLGYSPTSAKITQPWTQLQRDGYLTYHPRITPKGHAWLDAHNAEDI